MTSPSDSDTNYSYITKKLFIISHHPTKKFLRYFDYLFEYHIFKATTYRTYESSSSHTHTHTRTHAHTHVYSDRHNTHIQQSAINTCSVSPTEIFHLNITGCSLSICLTSWRNPNKKRWVSKWSPSWRARCHCGPTWLLWVPREVLVVVLDVQLLVRVVRHLRVQLRVGGLRLRLHLRLRLRLRLCLHLLLLRGPGAHHAAARDLHRLGGRECVSVLRAPGPGGLGGLASFAAPAAGGADLLLRLPLAPRESFLMDGKVLWIMEAAGSSPRSRGNSSKGT